MRKLFTAGLVGSLLLIGPSLAAAQTTSSTTNQQLIALLTQLVQTLEQQLAMLEANATASSQTTQTTQPSETNAPSTTPQAGGIVAPYTLLPETPVTGSSNTNITWADLGTAGAGYSVVGVGSFRGPGSHDVLFENGSGEVGYLTSQSVWYDLGNAGSYRVAGVSDMNGDGTSDIIFENGTSGGDVGYWVVNPNAVGNSAPQSSPNITWADLGTAGAGGYSVVGVGNFGGSGSHDILFQSTSGDVGYWTVVGSQISWIDLGNAGSYRVAGVSDMNGDGTSDIIFENGTSGGDIGYWIVNPNAVSTTASSVSTPVVGGTSKTATPVSGGTSNTAAPVSGGTSNTAPPVSGGTSNTSPPESGGGSSGGPSSVNNGPSIY